MDRVDHGGAGREAVWMSGESCSLADFRALIEQQATAELYPLAQSFHRNVPIYDGAAMREAAADEVKSMALMAEWHRVFLDGPGIIAIRNAFPDVSVVDGVSAELLAMVTEERAANGIRGDHFAKHGANARVWNTHEKLAMRAPELFARYNASDVFALPSRAWLGPLYQITAQVNLVYPGGPAQTPHRDYHMGFQTEAQLRHYPANTHRLSAALTLQGAVAHVDMPIESGPTKVLPYSQSYLPGYFATQIPAFRALFEERFVQLPLAKGDAMFFNPATFHAAGANVTTDIERLANLFQIGSAYGRSIEILDRARMTNHVYPTLLDLLQRGSFSAREIENVIAATAEGYPFPCNLDIDSPLSGMAPPSQQDLLRQALREGWAADKLTTAITAHVARRVSH